MWGGGNNKTKFQLLWGATNYKECNCREFFARGIARSYGTMGCIAARSPHGIASYGGRRHLTNK